LICARYDHTALGLSIDDGNILYNEIEHRRKELGIKRIVLDSLFSKMDTLDNDVIGALDRRLKMCVKKVQDDMQSNFYTKCVIKVNDPHQELAVYIDKTCVLQETRICRSIETCVCPVNDKMWQNFDINKEISLSAAQSSKLGSNDSLM